MSPSQPQVTDGRSPHVVLGVAGGIAAYKVASLLRLLTESGHDVRVVPTRAALRVRRRPHLGGPVRPPGQHRGLGRRPRGAARPARPRGRPGRGGPGHRRPAGPGRHGLADDLLTTTLLTARCPVLLVPAMHTEMWQHPATLANVATLRSRGVQVIEPASGRLTGADTGPGRLPEPEEILAECLRRSTAPGRRPRASATARAPRTSPAGTWWSAPAAPASRSTRSASWATAPPASRASPSPAPPPPVGPG